MCSIFTHISAISEKAQSRIVHIQVCSVVRKPGFGETVCTEADSPNVGGEFSIVWLYLKEWKFQVNTILLFSCRRDILIKNILLRNPSPPPWQRAPEPGGGGVINLPEESSPSHLVSYRQFIAKLFAFLVAKLKYNAI